MIPQNQLAFLLVVKQDSYDKLCLDLDEIAKNPANNTIFPFSNSKTTHFARWLIMPSKENGRYYLVFSSNFDGQSRKAHIEEWYDTNETGLDRLLSYCEDYSASATKAQKVNFLYKHRKNPAAFYIGTRGHSVQGVERDFKLRNFIRDFLDTKDYSLGQEKQVVQDVRQLVSSSDEFKWAMKKTSYSFAYRLKQGFQKLFDYTLLALFALVFIVGALGIVLVPLLIAFGVKTSLIIALGALTLWVIYIIVTLRIKETKDGVSHARISLERAEALGKVEDVYLQNQMTHLVTIKPGSFRAGTQRVALWGIYVLAKHYFNKGTLGGIPSIHFARWIIVDKRLLFFSNFDASWMNYLGDFIDKASVGLTAAWSSTEGFPKTKFLAFGGATMADRFKRWARNLQIPTQVWYSAYPNYSVENINTNAKIRQGLSANLSSDKARKQWLALL